MPYSRYLFRFLRAVAATNLLLLVLAAIDRSLWAVAIAYAIGPLINLGFTIGSLILIRSVKRRSQTFSLGEHIALSLVPLALIVLDLLAIVSMHLQH